MHLHFATSSKRKDASISPSDTTVDIVRGIVGKEILAVEIAPRILRRPTLAEPPTSSRQSSAVELVLVVILIVSREWTRGVAW